MRYCHAQIVVALAAVVITAPAVAYAAAPCELVQAQCCARPPAFDDPDYFTFGQPVAFATCTGPNPSSFVFGAIALETAEQNCCDQNFYAPMYHNEMPNPTNNPADVWNRTNLGNVFGLTIDDLGNVYVCASSLYGWDVYASGGAGAVYKIDGVTGGISLFATLPNAPDPNIFPTSQAWPALGNITYDCTHQQFFVTNIEDGKIYRLDTSGNVLSTFDPGAPDNGAPGFAPLGERLWAVEYFGVRVYYGVVWENEGFPNPAAKQEIWSVQVDGTGEFIPASAQLELQLPEYPNADYSSPVSDISFSINGRMVLAERSMMGDTFTSAHHSFVREYFCNNGVWTPGNGFSIGCYENMGVKSNAAGGVAHDVRDGRVWAMGDAIHFSTCIQNEYIYGLQGIPGGGGNVTNSVLIDLDADVTGTTAFKTYYGDVEIPCSPCFDAPEGLRGWWRGDGTADDASGYANNGTFLVNPQYTSAAAVGTASFVHDGASYVEVPDAPGLDFLVTTAAGEGDITIDCWVRFTGAITGRQTLVSKMGLDTNGVGMVGYEFFVDNGKLGTTISTATVGLQLIDSSTYVVPANQWVLLAIVVKRWTHDVEFYADNQLVAAYTPGSGIEGSLENDGPLRIGASTISGVPTHFATADIDEVELYARALTPQDIFAIHTQGSGGKCQRNLPFKDCNMNNVSDLVDIQTGSSLDLNGDDIPDECQNTVPVLDVRPSIVDVGGGMPGDTLVGHFRIRNTGGGFLTGTVSEACPEFAITSGGGPYNLFAGDSLVVTIRLVPPDFGTFTCEVDIGDPVQFVSVTGSGGTPTGIGTIPARFALEQNTPNPFNPSTRFNFSLDRAGRAALRIYDVAGRLVRTLVDRRLPAGPHTALWDARDAHGRPVASGVYFYRLESGGRTLTRKAVLLR